MLEPRYYGIPLEPLPTADSLWAGERIQVPPAVDGPVFISAGVLAGWEYGPGPLDPYAQFSTVEAGRCHRRQHRLTTVPRPGERRR